MPAIIWAQSALADLQAIEHYLDGIDPHIARDAVDAIIEATGRLEHYPLIGPTIGNGPARSLKVARLPYRIVYLVRNDAVSVQRVRHAREDWLAGH